VAGEHLPRREGITLKPVVRYLRFHCQSLDARPEPNRDGILAIAAIRETAHLARLLLVDMSAWGRNDGASVTSAAGPLMDAAHRRLIAGFGINLADTLVAELDGSGHFDLIVDLGDGLGHRHSPLVAGERGVAVRSREAFLCWAGEVGRSMLRTVDAVRDCEWAGVEG
jgi:hypothetical protein